ncbi:MAG TPA: RluA family pseudouridine synthase [Acidobacteriaceae bacterium]
MSTPGQSENFLVPVDAAGWRLDQYVVSVLPALSRSRVQQLVSEGQVLVNGAEEKASLKLRGGEHVSVHGQQQPAPLETRPEAIPLEVVYEDEHLAVINKPAGMMVHAGSGLTDEARSGGTLVNALLHRFPTLSSIGGDLRPGIVHRLDKETSGLIVIARTDEAHEALAAMFSERRMTKTYLALVQGHLAQDAATIQVPIGRDASRRTRMTTRKSENARHAVSHYRVVERLSTRFGAFTLVRVRIETGRTHQIRVHMSSINHPVVGDTLYGAAGRLTNQPTGGNRKAPRETLTLNRNFLHSTELEFIHPITQKSLSLQSPLPSELEAFLSQLRGPAAA